MSKSKILYFIVILILTSCVHTSFNDENLISSGIYAYPSIHVDFRIPSDYDVIFLGEQHGDLESKIILKDLIQYLYESMNCRDIALEEDFAYTEHANHYVEGQIPFLREELSLRQDVLDVIKELNEEYINSPIKVHLIDVDSPKSAIDEHLRQLLNDEMSEKFGITQDMMNIPKEKVYEIIEYLKNKYGNTDLISEIHSLLESVDLYYDNFILTEFNTVIDRRIQSPKREAILTRNILSLKNKLKSKPLLVFIGGAHAVKSNQFLHFDYLDPVASQLINNNLKVYSIGLQRISGTYNWRGRYGHSQIDLDEIIFYDNTTLKDKLWNINEYKVLRLDMNSEYNNGLDISYMGLNPGTGNLLYDEILFINEATAME